MDNKQIFFTNYEDVVKDLLNSPGGAMDETQINNIIKVADRKSAVIAANRLARMGAHAGVPLMVVGYDPLKHEYFYSATLPQDISDQEKQGEVKSEYANFLVLLRTLLDLRVIRDEQSAPRVLSKVKDEDSAAHH